MKNKLNPKGKLKTKKPMWTFEPVPNCSKCGEEACENLIVSSPRKASKRKRHLVRDCEPMSYEQLPQNLKKEVF